MALQVGELFALFTADDTEFNKVLGQAESSFKAVGDEFMKIGKTMTATVTAPIVGTGVAALKMAGDFEASGLKVATIADQSVISFEDMQDGVLGLSNDVGISAEEINAALYEVLSATNDTANALAYTEIAAKTAKAGFTDTATSVDGLTTVLNAYGIKGGAAMQKVADQMMVAQNLGKTTFGEMASSIGNVIPIAASMQISTDSLFASLAALTSNGIKTSEAVTGIKAALSNVIKPTKEASEMSEALGLEFNAAHLKSVGWANFLDEVAKKTGGDTEKMAQLFGSVEALNTVTVLATTGAAGFDSALEAMGKSAGTTQSAFDTLNQGMNNGISRTMNLLKNLGIDIGTLLAPSIENVTLHIQDFVKWLSSLDDGTKQTIITTAGLVAAIGPLLLIVGTLFGSVSNIIGLYTTLSTSMAGLGVGFGSLILPIALVAAAIAGLVAAVIYLWNTDEDFRNAVIDAWGDIQQVIDGSVKAILQFLNGDLEGGLETLHESFIDVFGEGITNEVMRCVSVIVPLLSDAWTTIKETAIAIWTELTTYWTDNNNLVVKMFKAAWDLILSILSIAWKFIKESAIDVFNFLKAFWEDWGGTIISLFKIAWDTVSEDFMAVVQVLTGIMKVLTGILTGDWKMALEGMKDIFDGVWRAIVAAFKGFINIIITGINTLITGLNKIHFSVPDWVPGLGGMSWGIDIPKIPMLAKGGIIDSPTLAMIGEGAEAEAVTPISVLRSMIQDAVSSVSGTVGGGIVQHFYFNNVMPMSVSETARKFKQAGKELALEWGN